MLPSLLAVATGGGSAAASPWVASLPEALAQSILWLGDHEEGSLGDWHAPGFQYPGGGIFNTGGAEVEAVTTDEIVFSGGYAARATIRGALRAENGPRAVRLMRWTDRAWDDGGIPFPAGAYYSTWMYLPHAYNPNKYAPWDPGDGGWWNVFQFKSDDANGLSQPIWTLDIGFDDSTGELSFYLYSKENVPASHEPLVPQAIPIGEWFHIEAEYVESVANTGRIRVWQDGLPILDVDQVKTRIVAENATVWGIGNYTDHIAGGPIEGTASIYFDDAIVATERIGSALPEPTMFTLVAFGGLYVVLLTRARAAEDPARPR